MADRGSAGIELGNNGGQVAELHQPIWPELQVLGLRKQVFNLLDGERGKPLQPEAGEEHLSATAIRDEQGCIVRGFVRRVCAVEPDELTGEDAAFAPGELLAGLRVWKLGSNQDTYRDVTFRESGQLVVDLDTGDMDEEQRITSAQSTARQLEYQRGVDKDWKAAMRQGRKVVRRQRVAKIFKLGPRGWIS